MSRKPRIHRPSAFYHVMLRGNNGQEIFFSDRDRYRICLLLQEGVERFEQRIHGFCLMSNHIHLIVQSGTVPLSQSIHHLASCYARYINYTYQRIGHVFQGRFKAILVDAENYLSELIRYVHLNPIRAGLVQTPEEYSWSSHRAYTGLTEISWVTQDWILNKFHEYEAPARTLYSEFVKRGMGETKRSEFCLGLREGRFLGDDIFIEQVTNEMKNRSAKEISVEHFMNIVAEVTKISIIDMQSRAKTSELSRARGIAALLVREIQQLTVIKLANFLGKTASTLSQLASLTAQRAKSDSTLSKHIEQTRHLISNLTE